MTSTVSPSALIENAHASRVMQVSASESGRSVSGSAATGGRDAPRTRRRGRLRYAGTVQLDRQIYSLTTTFREFVWEPIVTRRFIQTGLRGATRQYQAQPPGDSSLLAAGLPYKIELRYGL